MTAGAALPSAIAAMLQSLLNDPFQPCYEYMLRATTEFGYAVCDIVTELAAQVALLELPDAVVAHLLDRLSSVEHRLSHGTSEKLQLGALVGAFVVARHMIK